MKRVFLRILAYALCVTLLLGALPARASVVQYDLFITSVRVTEENRGDILGDGVFRFDGDRTLVVCGDCDSPDLPVISSGIPGLVIRVQKPSTLSCGENPAILALADLTLTGPAALALESENCGVFMRSCSLTVSALALFASGRWGLAGDQISDENCALRIDCADLDVKSTDGAICDFAQGIELDRCAVTAPANHVLGDYAVKTEDLRIAREVVIRHTGAMEAPAPYTHTVTFVNTRGEDPAPQTVADGACAEAPAPPTAEGARFSGWCSDPECTAAFDFSAPITEDTQLYSAWTAEAGQQADRSALESALLEAAALDAGNYSEASFAVLQAVLAHGRVIADDAAASQAQLDAAVACIRAAVAALAPKPAEIDRSVLAEAIRAAKAVDPSEYTPRSYAVLDATLDAAQTALQSGDQAMVDSVARALLAAMNLLEAAQTPEIPEEAKALAEEISDAFGCVPVPGGDVYTSELEAGRSYFFWESVRLHIDAPVHCPTLYVHGRVQIDGGEKLTAEILFADDAATVLSGSILCPEMDNPPAAETTVRNGVTAIGGLEIVGGDVRCPVISSGPETVHVSGGEVNADTISALFGYTQEGGTVNAGSIWAREGFCVSGGTLNLGSANSEFFRFVGGVITISGALSYNSEAPHTVEIVFPMYIAVPEGGVYADGRFLDQNGAPAETVRLEAGPVTHPFRDVQPNAYYYEAMLWAYAHEPQITKGTTASTFSPNAACTRGQVVTFLWRARGCPAPKHRTLPFTDVTEDAFYYEAVLWAVENGITNGVDASHFGPGQSCTRAQVVTFLWRDALLPEPNGGGNSFTDVTGGYYARAVAWAVENHITNGTDDTHFSPDVACTRGQIVTFLYRAMGRA